LAITVPWSIGCNPEALPDTRILRILVIDNVLVVQGGPFLRTQEGEESAMLCNFEDDMEGASEATACPDFEVVSPTAHKFSRFVALPS